MSERYAFVPLREDDLPLVERWLLEPHVRRWWNDDPDEDDYPQGTLAEWRRAIRGEDPTRMYRIDIDGRPAGVMQSYVVQDYPDYLAELGGLAERALSIDLFIGEPGLVGRGHGPDAIRAFLREERARVGIEYCVIGPATANVAAIRAYEKAGFRYLRPYREPDTTDPEHLLLDLRLRDLG